MIPAGQYSPRAVQRLKEYLLDELKQARADRREKEEIWITCHEAYYARPVIGKSDDKTFPFHGASNLVIPIVATDVDTVFARMMGLIFEPESLFSVSASMPEMGSAAPRVEEFLKWSQHNEVDWQSPVGDWILEILKLGTGVLKTRYDRKVQNVFEWRELAQGTWQQQATILLKDAPSVHRVPLFDYYVPAGFRHQNTLPWQCEQFYLTWRQFQNRLAQGLYQPTARISETFANSAGSQVESRLQELSGFKQARGNKLKLQECWTNWDVSDGVTGDMALKCVIHEDSGDYVDLSYNPFFNQEPPYDVARFMRDENSFYGIGLGEMGLNEQEEITAMHNQRIDNGTVLNSGMIAVKKGSDADEDGETAFFPGKKYVLNNPNEDIKLLSWGGSNPVAGSIAAEQETTRVHQQRTGINDWMMAMGNQTTAYGAASTNNLISQNATRRQGEFLRELRNALSGSGTKVLELYQQFNQRGKEFFALGIQDGSIVRQVLQFPVDLIRRGLKVNVTAIDVASSKDVKMRSNMLAMQQLMQYYQQVFQALQIAGNQMLPAELRQTAVDMIRGSSLMMHDILDNMGVQEADKMLPRIAGVVNEQQQRMAALQQLIRSGPQNAPGGLSQAPGMGNLPGLAQPMLGASQAGPQPVARPGGYSQGAGSPPLFGGGR